MGVIRRKVSGMYDLGGDIKDLNWEDSFHSDSDGDERLGYQIYYGRGNTVKIEQEPEAKELILED